MFCQITKNFDLVVALASHPKPTKLGRIYFENNKDLSVNVRNQFNSFHVSCQLETSLTT